MKPSKIQKKVEFENTFKNYIRGVIWGDGDIWDISLLIKIKENKEDTKKDTNTQSQNEKDDTNTQILITLISYE